MGSEEDPRQLHLAGLHGYRTDSRKASLGSLLDLGFLGSTVLTDLGGPSQVILDRDPELRDAWGEML